MRTRDTTIDCRPRAEALESRRLFAAPGEVIHTVAGPTGHTYHLLERTTWDDAEEKSVDLGGHLVVVNDPAEQDFLWSTFGPLTGLFWIGFTDAAHEGQYVWTTGEPPTYTNWFAGEPNNQYPSGESWASMWGDYNNGQWNDLGPDSDQGVLQYAVAEVRNGPDLYATVGALPESTGPGATFTLTGTLKNLGSATASGSTRVTFFLSTNSTLDGADIALGGDFTAPGNLAFNQSIPISANLTIPSGLAPNSYVVLAQVDADDEIDEADETNNVTATAAFDVGAVMEPVFRTVRGFVRDGDNLPLHGVSVTAGTQTVFTDYDGRKSAIDRDGVNGDFELLNALVGHNMTFGGTFGRFVPVTSDDAKITATANDLAGTAFSHTVDIDEILPFDTTLPDGGLARGEPATLRPIFLADYLAVDEDPATTIRLHRDLRNDKNSDRISAKPSKTVGASARYQKGVETVTARLSTLGFRESGDTPLVTVSTFKKNAPADRAIKLFKVLASVSTSKPTGIVEETTLAALNANPVPNGLMWTNVPPPKWSVAPGVADAYVSKPTFEKVRALAENSPVAEFVLTRASPSTGGTGKTFLAGGEIEFRWASSSATQSFWEPLEGLERKDVTLLGGKKIAVPDPAQLGVQWQYVAGYDQTATRDIVQSLLNAGATRVTFNDPAILQELGAVTVSTVGTKSVMTVVRADLKPAAGGDAVIHAKL